MNIAKMVDTIINRNIRNNNGINADDETGYGNDADAAADNNNNINNLVGPNNLYL